MNALISRSKSFWNYDQEYLKAAIPLIQLTETWLEVHEGYTIRENTKVLGFLGIEEFNNYLKLEHLWIEPEEIRKGYGREAFYYLCKLAEVRSINKILIIPDPPAENFYFKLGARFTGKKIISRVHNGPIFQEMIFTL